MPGNRGSQLDSERGETCLDQCCPSVSHTAPGQRVFERLPSPPWTLRALTIPRTRRRLELDSPNHLPKQYRHTLRHCTTPNGPAGSLSDWPFCQLAVRKCAIRGGGIFGWTWIWKPGKEDGQANNSRTPSSWTTKHHCQSTKVPVAGRRAGKMTTHPPVDLLLCGRHDRIRNVDSWCILRASFERHADRRGAPIMIRVQGMRRQPAWSGDGTMDDGRTASHSDATHAGAPGFCRPNEGQKGAIVQYRC